MSEFLIAFVVTVTALLALAMAAKAMEEWLERRR